MSSLFEVQMSNFIKFGDRFIGGYNYQGWCDYMVVYFQERYFDEIIYGNEATPSLQEHTKAYHIEISKHIKLWTL